MLWPLLFICLSGSAAGAVLPNRPSVHIRNGTVVGRNNGTIDSFLGIPYVEAPVGDLRLRKPQSIGRSFGSLQLSNTPTACINMNLSQVDASGIAEEAAMVLQNLSSNFTGLSGEDCLTINVQRPSDVRPDQKLPVLFWIYGGGWEIGTTQFYDGTKLIELSMTLNQSVIFVAANYRLNAFGFLQGKQLQAEGNTNLGLHDQRKALEWVAENIAAFGGDPDKVTIWGESAGAASVFDHLLINGGDHKYHGRPLFRAAIMNSGTALPVLPVESRHSQDIFDRVATAAGCPSSSGSSATLDCLRKAPLEAFTRAMNSVPNFMDPSSNALSYIRRPDSFSSFYNKDALTAVRQGEYAHVPIITLSLEDEATPFGISQRNIINSTQTLIDYFTTWFPEAPRRVIKTLIEAYPPNPADGLPARTGQEFELYPNYKRNVAIQTDITFTMWRRIVLGPISAKVPTWSGLGTYLHGKIPTMGTYHTSDLATQFNPTDFAGQTLDAAYLNFVNHLDPNGDGCKEKDVWWPRWEAMGLRLAEFGTDRVGIRRDDFRTGAERVLRTYAAELKQ